MSNRCGSFAGKKGTLPEWRSMVGEEKRHAYTQQGAQMYPAATAMTIHDDPRNEHVGSITKAQRVFQRASNCAQVTDAEDDQEVYRAGHELWIPEQ